MQVTYTSDEMEKLIEAFSPERLGRYLQMASRDKETALAYYALNMQLSEALYPALQILEVVLRNRVSAVLNKSFGEMWFDNRSLHLLPPEQQKISDARAELIRERKSETLGQLVATLSFDFWTGLLSPRYDTLWKTDLNRIVRMANGKGLSRKLLAGKLREIRRLRNRIAHHESILTLPVMQRYEDILQVMSWISPEAVSWTKKYSRFLEIYPTEQAIISFC